VSLIDESFAAFRAGENPRARALAEQARADAQGAGDVTAEVDALCMLARVALRDGALDDLATLATEARLLAGQSDTPRLQRIPVHMQAVAARMRGDSATARRLYEESIDLNRELGEERMVAAEHHNLAYVELRDGNVERARELFATARGSIEQGGFDELLPYVVGDAAVLAAVDGDHRRAARLAGSARAAFEAAGQVADPDDAAEQERLRRTLVDAMGEQQYATAEAEGAAIPITAALAVA
jgi:hypothetical protein